jgi:hypothetical protein
MAKGRITLDAGLQVRSVVEARSARHPRAWRQVATEIVDNRQSNLGRFLVNEIRGGRGYGGRSIGGVRRFSCGNVEVRQGGLAGGLRIDLVIRRSVTFAFRGYGPPL